ncbi:MAG TPA: GNAT family N-acetyltransferase [Candidatus Limnocylindria bacterium]
MVDDDIRVRRVAPGDAPELERFYAELSAESRALRFHGASRGIGHEQADRFAAADHRLRDGLVAVADGRIAGHLVLERVGDGVEELAVAVDDRVQHHGVGTLLLAAAVASARLRHVRRLVAWVKAENVAMRHLLNASHHPLRLSWEGSVARYELEVPVNLPGSAAA